MPRRSIWSAHQRAALFDLPTDEAALLRHYTLSYGDIEQIRVRRGGHNRLVSRASTKHTSGAEQKCTTREVIGQRKCPRQLFGRSVPEAGWQQAGRVSE